MDRNIDTNFISLMKKLFALKNNLFRYSKRMNRAKMSRLNRKKKHYRDKCRERYKNRKIEQALGYIKTK